ncbi:MAG: nitrate/nitrite transporter NrtS [Calothrix sp. C42_A2020_038]|nr:nitrate/nitrite transporter NrtS [Calothrix sp. C42_A2020_038]
MKAVIQYFYSLFDRKFALTGFKVAVVVGTILFAINHGWALLNDQMNRGRWISAGLTYIVPYLVNVHGQYISRLTSRNRYN